MTVTENNLLKPSVAVPSLLTLVPWLSKPARDADEVVEAIEWLCEVMLVLLSKPWLGVKPPSLPVVEAIVGC